MRATDKAQKKVINNFARLIPELSLASNPPEIARNAYALLKKISSNGDPYKEIKEKSNRLALSLYPKLKNKVAHSKDRLLCAIELAIAGNVIDFGVKNNVDVEAELKKILSEESRRVAKKSIFHYAEFKSALKKAHKILYLADNCGEVVFDRVLIEEINNLYPGKAIDYAVKEKPVINDALLEDAKKCGINRIAKIISNGTDAPGTILNLCSGKFKAVFKTADMIISKGQGNFESLSNEKKPIFFLFMVKCPVVARNTGCKMGHTVLLYNSKKGIFRKGW